MIKRIMEVYIEYVIIDNLVLTYLIGAVTYRALKSKQSPLRNGISAVVGTTAAVFFPFLTIHATWIFMLKIALGIVLSLILFYKKSKLFISTLTFLFITFLFGGIFFAIGLAVHGNAVAALTRPVSDLPIGLCILAACMVFVLLRRFFLLFHKNKDVRQSIYEVEFCLLGKCMRAKAFLDTGNRLYDGKSGLPVVVLSFHMMASALSSEQLIKAVDGRGAQLAKGAYYMDYATLGRSGSKLLVIKPEKFRLYLDADKNIHKDVVLGLTCASLKDSMEYDAIMGPSILE